jgi:hypothetical protein
VVSKEGGLARAGYLTSSKALEATMPEIFDLYNSLCEAAGGGDLSSRFLSMFTPSLYERMQLSRLDKELSAANSKLRL